MAESSRRPFLDIQPGPAEADALRLAANYLRRAGTRTATGMLSLEALADDARLQQAIRDNLFAAADLCDSLVALRESDQQQR